MNVIPNRRTVFSPHGLGDSIVCNGICRTMAKDGAPLEWFTSQEAYPVVRQMYSDLPNVHCWWISYPHEHITRWAGNSPGAIHLGPTAPESDLFEATRRDLEFYRQAGLPFRNRWDAFALPDALLGPTPPPCRAILFHDDPDRGFNIDITKVKFSGRCYYRRVTPELPFWDWIPMLREAEELHLIDSVFLRLADSLWAKGLLSARRLVFHAYPRDSVPPTLRGPWEVRSKPWESIPCPPATL